MDLSHHMTDLFLRGPGALQLLSDLGVNSFANFTPGKAKQLVVCNPDGFYIGDGILYHLPDGSFDLVGWEMMADWVQYHLETGGYDATSERDNSSGVRKDGPPKLFRYQIQGPQALPVMEKVLGQSVPPVKFFHMDEFTIAGHPVHTLRHGMAAQPGFELFGPWALGDEVLDAILTAGKEFGMRRVGAKAYSVANLESGWIPPTLPAVFSGEETLGFRKWVGTETIGSLGGSLFFEEIEDYYVTPFDLGYSKNIAFDHDFVGRKALEQVAKDPPRTKVTLVWNPEDVARVLSTHFDSTSKEPAKYINLPKARYALYQKDEVRYEGRRVGVSMDCGLISNEKAMVSLATIDKAQSSTGTRVTVLWGEVPNSAKPQVESHVQVEIRATVAPAPYPEIARRVYRDR
jgi:glycine cleavage system aminomethyltransferase T